MFLVRDVFMRASPRNCSDYINANFVCVRIDSGHGKYNERAITRPYDFVRSSLYVRNAAVNQDHNHVIRLLSFRRGLDHAPMQLHAQSN